MYELISFITASFTDKDGKVVNYATLHVLDTTLEKEQDQKTPIKLKVALPVIDNVDELKSMRMGTKLDLTFKPDSNGNARVISINKA